MHNNLTSYVGGMLGHCLEYTYPAPLEFTCKMFQKRISAGDFSYDDINKYFQYLKDLFSSNDVMKNCCNPEASNIIYQRISEKRVFEYCSEIGENVDGEEVIARFWINIYYNFSNIQ